MLRTEDGIFPNGSGWKVPVWALYFLASGYARIHSDTDIVLKSGDVMTTETERSDGTVSFRRLSFDGLDLGVTTSKGHWNLADLVADTFCDQIKGCGRHIQFLDGDRMNCRWDNLLFSDIPPPTREQPIGSRIFLAKGPQVGYLDERYVAFKAGHVYDRHSKKMLAISLVSQGYPRISLPRPWTENSVSSAPIHRVIALSGLATNLPPTDRLDDYQVDHLDHDRMNRNGSNLQFTKGNLHRRAGTIMPQFLPVGPDPFSQQMLDYLNR